MGLKGQIANLQDFSSSHFPAFDFHIHTSWTDGANTPAEMHDEAVKCGLEVILFSEHGRKTSGDWFPEFAEEIRILPTDECRALVGLEAKVEDFEGNIDTTDEILGSCDLVMASVHRFPGKDGKPIAFADVDPDEAVDIEFELAMSVLENPAIDILGHPFGMSYKRHKATPGESRLKEVIRKAARFEVAFEVNSRYHPDPWRLIELCKQAGAPISLGSNAHRVNEVGQIIRVLNRQEEPWKP